MRYCEYRYEMSSMEYVIGTYHGEIWSEEYDLWEELGIEPRQQALVIENADRLSWEKWMSLVVPCTCKSGYDGSDDDFREEVAEMETHYLEILRGTYPGYLLGRVTAYLKGVELCFFKEESSFYFTVSLNSSRDNPLDFSLIGPKTSAGVCPHYRVQYSKTTGTAIITERRGDTIRIMHMCPEFSSGPNPYRIIYLDIQEFMDI